MSSRTRCLAPIPRSTARSCPAAASPSPERRLHRRDRHMMLGALVALATCHPAAVARSDRPGVPSCAGAGRRRSSSRSGLGSQPGVQRFENRAYKPESGSLRRFLPSGPSCRSHVSRPHPPARCPTTPGPGLSRSAPQANHAAVLSKKPAGPTELCKTALREATFGPAPSSTENNREQDTHAPVNSNDAR